MLQNNTYLSALDKSKLDKLKEVELAKAKKIQLNAIEDANSTLERAYDNLRTYQAETKNLNKDIEKFESIFAEMQDYSLTINQGIDEISDMIALAENSIDEITKGADELGLNPSDITQYKQLNSLIDELEAFSSKLEDYYDKINRIL